MLKTDRRTVGYVKTKIYDNHRGICFGKLEHCSPNDTTYINDSYTGHVLDRSGVEMR